MARGRGLFVVLEGVEGAGKSTQARRLDAWLSDLGIPHRSAREPGGTGLGEEIRNLLLERKDLLFSAESELLLMLAARAAFVREVVRPALDRGEVLVSDRFELSTFAYQGGGRALGVERIRPLNKFATGGIQPDLTLFFDLPIPVGRARQSREGRDRDRIEGEDDGFLEAVRATYLTLVQDDPRVERVDASPDPDTVHREVRRILERRFPEPFTRARG